ncbi:MAG: chloride channel protein, partial [Isosphaeraceae bacterium]|nr:chloride channel protein [Isosphaeraceae bacterium]
ILGALESAFLPGGDKAFWPLVSMAAVLGGTMRAPLMATVFALELTHDIQALLPLLMASVVSYALATSIMRYSILTEKVARRGYRISHEYAVDPLERLSAGQVMTADVITVPAALPVGDLIRNYFFAVGPHKHPAYPVVGKDGKFLGLVTQSSLLEHWVTALLSGNQGAGPFGTSPIIAYDLIEHRPVITTPEESCRAVAERMAQTGVKRLPVVSADDPNRLVGIVTLGDLLKARQRLLEEEARRERFFFGPGQAPHAPRPT